MNLLRDAEFVVLALIVASASGAVTGVRLAGRDLGNALAGMLGGFYGPTSVVPAAIFGLAVLMWLK